MYFDLVHVSWYYPWGLDLMWILVVTCLYYSNTDNIVLHGALHYTCEEFTCRINPLPQSCFVQINTWRALDSRLWINGLSIITLDNNLSNPNKSINITRNKTLCKILVCATTCMSSGFKEKPLTKLDAGLAVHTVVLRNCWLSRLPMRA